MSAMGEILWAQVLWSKVEGSYVKTNRAVSHREMRDDRVNVVQMLETTYEDGSRSVCTQTGCGWCDPQPCAC